LIEENSAMRTLRAGLAVLAAASLAAAPLVGCSTGSTTAGTSYDWRFNTLEADLAHPLDGRRAARAFATLNGQREHSVGAHAEEVAILDDGYVRHEARLARDAVEVTHALELGLDVRGVEVDPKPLREAVLQLREIAPAGHVLFELLLTERDEPRRKSRGGVGFERIAAHSGKPRRATACK